MVGQAVHTVTRMMIDCIVLELKAPGMTSGEFINDIFRYVIVRLERRSLLMLDRKAVFIRLSPLKDL